MGLATVVTTKWNHVRRASEKPRNTWCFSVNANDATEARDRSTCLVASAVVMFHCADHRCVTRRVTQNCCFVAWTSYSPPPDVTFSQTSPDRLAREALSLTAEWSIDKQSFSARCGWVLLTSNCIGLGLSTKRANFKAFSDTKVLFLWTRYLAAFARHLLRVFLAFFFIRYALKRWERAASLVHVLYRARLLIVRRFALLRQHQRCSFRHKCVCVSRTCTARQSGNDQLIPVETSDARSIRNWRQFYDWADSRFCLWSLNDVNEVVWWMECWVLCLGWKHVRCGRSLLFCLRLPCNTNCTNFKVRFCLRKVLNQWFSSWGLRPQTPPWGSFAFLLVIESF